jgi:hypothetical protein
MLEAQTPTLAGLKKPADYQSENSEFFPTMWSLKWALRLHRDRLVAANAIEKVGGRTWIRPAAFEAVVLDAGRAALQGAHHG